MLITGHLLRPHPWDSPGKNTGVGCHFLLNAWKWKVKVKSLSHVWLFETPWTAAYQAPPSWDFPGKSTGVGCHGLLRLSLIRQHKTRMLAEDTGCDLHAYPLSDLHSTFRQSLLVFIPHVHRNIYIFRERKCIKHGILLWNYTRSKGKISHYTKNLW